MNHDRESSVHGRDAVSDEALMRLAAADDVLAFEALVHRYRATLVTYLSWLSGDRHLAEDAAQEILVKLQASDRTQAAVKALRAGWLP